MAKRVNGALLRPSLAKIVKKIMIKPPKKKGK